MKIRSGFVSNSSSSSFAICLKKDKTPKLLVEIDLESFEERRITTVEELNEYVLEESGMDTIDEMLAEDRYWAVRYKSYLKFITGGDTIMIGRVCNDSGEADEMFVYDIGVTEENTKDCIVVDTNG